MLPGTKGVAAFGQELEDIGEVGIAQVGTLGLMQGDGRGVVSVPPSQQWMWMRFEGHPSHLVLSFLRIAVNNRTVDQNQQHHTGPELSLGPTSLESQLPVLLNTLVMGGGRKQPLT